MIIIWARSCENVSYAICEQQRCRLACASAQSDQHLCCSLLRQYDMYTSSIKILASFCSWAGWFESYLVENPRRHIFAWCGSYLNIWFILGWNNKLNLYFENLWCYQASVKWVGVSVYWKMWFVSRFNVISRVYSDMYPYVCTFAIQSNVWGINLSKDMFSECHASWNVTIALISVVTTSKIICSLLNV